MNGLKLPAHAVKPTHVIIGGIVFPWAAKAPYVASGHSVLGGLEYNEAEGLIKCHVCGCWTRSVGKHAAAADGVSPRDYRRDYGLRNTTSLCTPSTRARYRANVRISALLPEAKKHRFVKGPSLQNRKHATGKDAGLSAETRNLRMLCAAQIRVRVTNLAIAKGATPTHPDLKLAGIHPAVIKATYGLSLRDFMKSLGLTPNTVKSPRSGEPLPKNVGHYVRVAGQ